MVARLDVLGTGMKRRELMTLFLGAIAWPIAAAAQNPANSNQDANEPVGQVATMQGIATVTRGNAAPSALNVSDAIYKKDVLQTGANSSLGITFDDETTLSLRVSIIDVSNHFGIRS